jgi:hypothetical protein
MKKSLALLVGVLMTTSVFAGPQAGTLPEPKASASVTSPVVIPEPTAATLLLVSIAACGLRRFRQRRNA